MLWKILNTPSLETRMPVCGFPYSINKSNPSSDDESSLLFSSEPSSSGKDSTPVIEPDVLWEKKSLVLGENWEESVMAGGEDNDDSGEWDTSPIVNSVPTLRKDEKGFMKNENAWSLHRMAGCWWVVSVVPSWIHSRRFLNPCCIEWNVDGMIMYSVSPLVEDNDPSRET